MPLRDLARKLLLPAAAAVQRASPPPVSPAPGARPLASHPSQNGGRRKALKHARRSEQTFRDLEKEIIADMEKDLQKLQGLSKSIDNMPRNIILTWGIGAIVLASATAYVCGAIDRSRKYGA